ncbi:hypothetical protein F5887DRAFT_1067704 [Amanita rubescens]|nr:hypothetical protein F5887DRAFT_1067704 [Amanita rubescens]
MLHEEQEWRNSQQPIPAVGDELETEDRMDMDFDVNDVGADVIPGCYVLNIGIEALERSKIWIRADYIRVYNYLETINDGISEAEEVAPGAIITGQPGIGKSVWVYYVLRRRLAERKAVIWYREGSCLLFVEEGVYRSPHNFSPSFFHKFVWTVVDSDESKEGIQSNLVPHGTRLFMIYSTSPSKERWKRLHKTVSVMNIIMNPWTRTEISYAASIRGIADHAGINDVYDRFGPVPRLCIDIFGKTDQFEYYKMDVCKAISNITLEYLARVFEEASSLRPDDISHKICLITRKDRNNVASVPIRQDQIRLYKRFEKVPGSRGLAGILFEAVAQNSLGDGMQLDLIRMVRKSDPQPGGQPQWHSSHLHIADPTLEGFRREAITQGTKILLDPSQVLEYDEGGLESITSNVYYVHQHGIKEGLLKFQPQCTNLPPIDQWCFVFIIPPNLILKCPYPRLKELQK